MGIIIIIIVITIILLLILLFKSGKDFSWSFLQKTSPKS